MYQQTVETMCLLFAEVMHRKGQLLLLETTALHHQEAVKEEVFLRHQVEVTEVVQEGEVHLVHVLVNFYYS
jgi:hypothetical protein